LSIDDSYITSAQCPESAFLKKEKHQKLLNSIPSLSKNQMKVLTLTTEGHTLKSIGELLGFSESRTCQVKKEAIEKLRGF
jgi:RNA polymerase sigma factor (sigma-70 family)